MSYRDTPLSSEPTIELSHYELPSHFTILLSSSPILKYPSNPFPAMLHPELDSPNPECSIGILPPHYPAGRLPCYLDPNNPMPLSYHPAVPLFDYQTIPLTP